ncbi:hypothetical protein DENSPDRAFT_245362 [Dentipellis sp. KUC8613]|nr:hypothetical protein DENSPDRAFT_245362 [Dentipellis sp. KUC8613]
MDSSDDSIIVKRKRPRSRIPVDPCLGFYLDSSPGSSTPHAVPGLLAAPTSPTLSFQDVPFDVISSDYPDPLPPIVTVNEFLKRSTGKVVKRYTRSARYHPIVPWKGSDAVEPHDSKSEDSSDTIDDSISVANSSQSYRQSSTPASSPEPPRKAKATGRRRLRQRYKKSLAQRLHQAAVYSHVQLSDCALQDPSLAHIDGRPPLKFQPVHPEPLSDTPQSRWNVVDPKTRVSSMKNAAFVGSSDQDSLLDGRAHEYRPMARWKSHGNLALAGVDFPHTPGKPRRSRTRLPQSAQVPSLRFVPLPAHEDALRLRTQTCSSQIHQRARLTLQPDVPGIYEAAGVPQPLHFVKIQASSRVSRSKISDSANDSSPIYAPVVSAVTHSTRRDASSLRESLRTPHRLGVAPASLRQPKDDIPVLTSDFDDAPIDRETLSKPTGLKGLASFMDKFLETARNAARDLEPC